MTKSTIEAYICGAERSLADDEYLARGAFKLGIAHQALGALLDPKRGAEYWEGENSEWWDKTSNRIGDLLLEYEQRIG